MRRPTPKRHHNKPEKPLETTIKRGRDTIDAGMTWTLLKAAEEFGVSREKIRRGLRLRGVDKTEAFTTREIFAAIAGDWDFERTRRERAEADKAEIEAAVAKGTHIPRDDVANFIQETFSPLREKIVAMPSKLSGLCNPSDPEHARQHLERFRDEFLKLRALVPEPAKEATKE